MDKLTRNFIAGLLAGIIKDLPILITHIFWDFPKIAYWSYASQIGFGIEDPETFFEYMFAVPIELLFGATIGIIYIFIVNYFKPKHYLLTGAYLGLSTWFLLRAIVVLFKIQPFQKPGIIIALINCSLSILFGFTVIYINNYLEKRSKSWK
jgi:hypothetical protein